MANNMKGTYMNQELVTKSTSPSMEQIKKDLFIAIEVLNGYTEKEAAKNYECEHGKCACT